MTLLAGDLTTPQRAAVWLPAPPTLPSAIISQLITSCTALIYNKLNRPRLYSRTHTATLDGVGNYQIVLPAWPVTGITSLQIGNILVNPFPLPTPGVNSVPPNTFGFGYRFIPWGGGLPGDPSVVEMVHGSFWAGTQNIKVTFTAGYLISAEAQTVPAGGGGVTVLQPQGPWCRDNGVAYAATGAALTPVASAPGLGQYIPPLDSQPGLYTFSVADAAANVLISYSFIPADLEEACIQMVAERMAYRSRIGELSKSLGGQETVRFLRGGMGRASPLELPPEVESLIQPYINVMPPAMGAPL